MKIESNYVFISYCHKDEEEAIAIAKLLEDHNINVWDDKNIDNNWRKEIEQHINTCTVFLCILSHNYFDSWYCTSEMHHALDKGKTIVPIMLEDYIATGFNMDLNRYQKINKYEMNESEFSHRLKTSSTINTCRKQETKNFFVVEPKEINENDEVFVRFDPYNSYSIDSYWCIGKVVKKTGNEGDGIKYTIQTGEEIKKYTDEALKTNHPKIMLLENRLVNEQLKKCPYCDQTYIRKEKEDENCFLCQEKKKEQERIEIKRRKEEEEKEKIEMESRIREKQEYFKNNIKTFNKKTKQFEPYLLDDEQAACLLYDSNVLVKARAGSGKTRVLTAKILDLCMNHDVTPDEILVFCFNHEARKEIKNRIQNDCLLPNNKKFYESEDENKLNSIVNTFHSFAYNHLKKEQICVDSEDSQRTKLIKAIITYLLDKEVNFANDFYAFAEEALSTSDFKSNSIVEFYEQIENSPQITLKNDHVENQEERLICNYLFEHGIKYTYYSSNYNPVYPFLKCRPTTLILIEDKQRQIFWNHWWCTGFEKDAEKKSFSGKYHRSYKDYIDSKNYYNNNPNSSAINSDPSNFAKKTKEECYKEIEKMLKEKGVVAPLLLKSAIIKKTWDASQDNFTKMIVSFIDRYQQVFFDNEDAFKQKLNSCRKNGYKKNVSFYNIGISVLEKYREILRNNKERKGNDKRFTDFGDYTTDFQQMIAKTIKKIKNNHLNQELEKTKWILIDEYQDFSKLFYELIKSILDINPKIKLFCVGDDWQAINSFAGSDIYYFENFQKVFKNQKSKICEITTNYRCSKDIIEFSNKFMKRMKITGSLARTKRGALKEVSEVNVMKYKLKKEEGEICDSNKNKLSEKSIYITYISTIAEIINEFYSNSKNLYKNNENESILILNRDNRFLKNDLPTAKRDLINTLINEYGYQEKQIEKQISFTTVHKVKGKEVPIVILTEVNEKKFPNESDDEFLFFIFNEHGPNNQSEENLYYVALTRAKDELYILYDKPSRFIACESEEE